MIHTMLTWGGSGLCSAACPAQLWTLWWWKFLGCRTNLASSFYTRTLKAFGTWTHTACMALSYDSTLYKQNFFLVRILLRIAQMTKKISFSPWTAPALQITERKIHLGSKWCCIKMGCPASADIKHFPFIFLFTFFLITAVFLLTHLSMCLA